MNLNWIVNSFFTVYAAIAAGMAALIYLWVSTRRELRLEQKRCRSDAAALQQEIVRLQSKMAELRAEANEWGAAPPVVAPGFNMHKSSEALRMCRRGSDNHTIAATLGMTQAELKLIRKAHLSAPAAAFPAYSERVLQASSSRAVYSAEA